MMDTLLTILILIATIALIGAAAWTVAMLRFLYILWHTTRDLEGDRHARRPR